MMTKRVWAGVLTTAVASVVWAQEPVLNPKLAELQPPKYTPPLCPLKANNGKIEKGLDLLKKSYDAKTPADKADGVKQAREMILQAITLEKQEANAAAWYYLARAYLLLGDVAGVDSAFTKAQKFQPVCELDINQYRQNNWAQLANAGLEVQKKGDIEGAIGLFRDASRLFSGLPQVLSNLGVLFANSSREDSAAVYFEKALAIAEKDTSLIEDRNSAAMNLALMYQRLERHKDAIPVLHKYLAWDPTSTDARKALAQSFRSAGMADSADALDQAMITEMSKQNLDSLDLNDLMNIGVAAFNAQRFQDAANAFSKALTRSPYSRDAVYNLANSYLALKNHEKLVETAAKLVEIEPMNEDVYRLLGQGHKGLQHDADVFEAAKRLVGLPINVEITAFQIGRSNAKLVASVTGRKPTDAQGKDIPTGPVTLVVEFLTSSGTVVDTKEVNLPNLPAGTTHQLSVEGKGAEISGWRYRNKAG